MSDNGMEEYYRAKGIRCSHHSVKLEPYEQKYILDLLPENPERPEMVGLGLSLGHNFQHVSELELYYMYEIKHSVGYLKAEVAKDKEFLYTGMLLPTYLWRFFSIFDGELAGGKRLPFERQKELCKECFDQWKKHSPKKHWKFTIKQIQQRLDIRSEIDAKRVIPKKLSKHAKQAKEATEFIQNLIK